MDNKLIEHLKELKKELKAKCTHCNGKGCIKCSSQFDLFERCAHSGIPLKYWNLDLNDLEENTSVKNIKSYMSKLDLAYKQGQGLFIFGKNGNGKTLSACAIGKEALRQNKTVRFTFLGEVISSFMNSMYDQKQRDALRKDILGVDFLILDDVDKAYISKDSAYVNSILDTLFRTRVQNCRPVIMTSNKRIDEILGSQSVDSEVFSKSLLSLFNESLISIGFVGVDKREELKQQARKRFLE
jgi:DNA replication protein DnaC